MNKIIVLILIISTMYTNNTQCMLSKEKRDLEKGTQTQHDNNIATKNNNKKNDSSQYKKELPTYDPASLRGVLKGHGNWVADIG